MKSSGDTMVQARAAAGPGTDANLSGPLQPRDEAIRDDLVERLGDSPALRDLPLRVQVRGGVAHVEGTVPDRAAREAVRRKLARVKDVHGVWDALVTPRQSGLLAIDIGCGGNKQVPWAVGVDRHPFPGVEAVMDLERGLPFADRQVDQVYAVHFLEHVKDLVALMNEIHRILKPGGLLHVITPHGSSPNAIGDPTHLRFFNRKTLGYFCEGHPWCRPFRPLCASHNQDDVFADLYPVQPEEPLPDEKELARFFG